MQKTRQHAVHVFWPMWVMAVACATQEQIVLGFQDDLPNSEVQQLWESQRQIADQYELLENKLFALHEFEKETNPLRSKLLKLAYLQSQNSMTARQLRQIGDLLDQHKLKDAEKSQRQVLVELNALRELLESEDRGKRIHDDIRRYQEYLKEISRLIRIQRAIRAQADGDEDIEQLSAAEANIGRRAGKLAGDIKRNEELSDPDQDAETTGQPADSDLPQPNRPGEDGGQSDNPPTAQESNGQPENGVKGEDAQPQQPGTQANPVREKIEAARDRMRRAQHSLEQAQRTESIQQMHAAEKELEQAKQELEKILRQLREEEVERTLAMLEGRFRQMLERELHIHEKTVRLDQIPLDQRETDFEIQSGRLGTEQNSLATEASRALTLLRDDGSSVAFPETVAQMRDDMIQVSQRLTSARIGKITIEIQQEIIETLQYLIEALVTTQQDIEKMKQNQPQGSGQGQPGDKALVDQLAEIKMLRGLQDRIYKRHHRYSQLLTDPQDLVGQADDVELQHALQRLAEKQSQLTGIARDIVTGKNR